MRYPPGIIVVLACVLLAACDEAPLPTGTTGGDECMAPALAPRDGACTDLEDFIHPVDLINTAGSARAVALAGSRLIVADGDAGIAVIEACDPAELVPAATLTLPGTALGVAAAGDMAYVAVGTEGVMMVDVGDPDRPVVVGQLMGVGSAGDIAVVVDDAPLRAPRITAYIADDAVGLIVADVSNPRAPRVLGIENTAGEARGVCVDGELAFVADTELGLRIAQVSDPDSPWLLGTVDVPGEPTAVALWHDLAVVAAGSAGLVTVDISTPADAAVSGVYDTADRANDVVVNDTGYAFVAERSDGLLAVDVTHPAAPALKARSGGEGFGTGVAIADGVVFIADDFAGVRAVDARTPWPPPQLARVAPAYSDANTLIARGNRFFVADENLDLWIGEWRDDHFARRGAWHHTGNVRNLVFHEEYLYLAVGDAGVRVIDVSDPDLPYEVAVLAGTDGAIDVAVADSVVFTVRGGTANPNMINLRRINDRPVVLGMPGGVVRAVDVGASFAYFVQVQGRLFVTTLDPSTEPPVHWVQSTNGNSTDVHVRGTPLDGGEWLFIANRQGKNDFSAGVEVYDLSAPLMPEFTALIETSIPAERIAFDGDIMFVAGAGDGLEVFDVSDIHHPRIVGAYSSASPVNGAVAVPGAILLAAGEGGVIAIPPRCE